MAKIDAIGSPRSLDRPVVDRERHRVALAKRDDFGPRLHPWPLFGQDEFSTREIAFGLRKQERYLNGKICSP